MLARSWRSTRPVKTRLRPSKDGEGSSTVQALKLECNCRGLASVSSKGSSATEDGKASRDLESGQLRESIRPDNPAQKDTKGKGRETTLENGQDSLAFSRQRFLRDPYTRSTTSSFTTPPVSSTSAELSELPEYELVAMFHAAVERKTAHPVRDSWRSFTALPLDRRRSLPVPILQQLIDIQFSRKIRKVGRASMLTQGPRMEILLQAIDGRKVDNEIFALLLDRARVWYEQLKDLEEIPAEDLESVTRVLVACLDGWTVGQDPKKVYRHLLSPLELLFEISRSLKPKPLESANYLDSQQISHREIIKCLNRLFLSTRTPPPARYHNRLSSLIADLTHSLCRDGQLGRLLRLFRSTLQCGILPAQDAVDTFLAAVQPDSLSMVQRRLRKTASQTQDPETIDWATRQFPLGAADANAAREQRDESSSSIDKVLSLAARQLTQAMHTKNTPQDGSSEDLVQPKETTSALLAMKVYQDLMSRGIQPDQRLYSILSIALRPLSSESIPFPLLRAVASVQSSTRSSNAVLPPQVANSALAKASPEQVLRLAVESQDFELASSLYRLLRSQNSFIWSKEDENVFTALFLAVAKDALADGVEGRGVPEKRRSVKAAVQLYLDWKMDGSDHATPEAVVQALAGTIPLVGEISLFRSALNALLADETVSISPGLLHHLLVACSIEMAQVDIRKDPSYSSIWKVPTAFSDILAYPQHATKYTLRSYNVVLRAFARYPPQKRFKWTKEVFRKMERNGIEADLESYNFMLEVCVSRSKTAHLALGFYRTMVERGIQPDRLSRFLLLRAYLGMGDLPGAISCAQEMMGEELVVSARSIAHILQKLVRRNRMMEARDLSTKWVELLEALQQPERLQKDVKNITIMLRANRIPLESLLSEEHLHLLDGEPLAIPETGIAQETVIQPATIAEKPRLAIPLATEVVGSVAEEEPRMITTSTQQDEQGQQQEGAQNEHQSWQTLPDQSFLTAFFTPNVETTSPESAVGFRLASEVPANRNESVADLEETEAHRQSRARPTQTHPPLPPSPTFAFPSFSQAFSTSSRSPSTTSVTPTPEAASPQSSSLFSSLSSLPSYLADLTFPQLSALYARYKLEMEVIEQETREQEIVRMQMATRADAGRWRGWKEAGAVPWY